MTNKNYLFSNTEGDRYVIRIPGFATEQFIDRGAEEKNSVEAFSFGFNPAKILCCDPMQGRQVTKYIENGWQRPYEDFYSEDVITQVAALLKSIHSSKLNFQNRVDVFRKIQCVIDLLTGKAVFPQEFFPLRQKIEAFQDVFSIPSFEFLPSHGDPVPGNFIQIKEKWMLLDWEYSGLNDPAWDLGLLSSVMNYSPTLEYVLINLYKTQQPELLWAKMQLFKPLIEYWLGLWGLLQQASRENQAEKEFFSCFTLSRFYKAEKYLESTEFSEALHLLRGVPYEKKNTSKTTPEWVQRDDMFSNNSYLYNEEGEKRFIKSYVPYRAPLLFPNFPIFSDEGGEFLIISIQFGCWICPYCGILTSQEKRFCMSPCCMMHE